MKAKGVHIEILSKSSSKTMTSEVLEERVVSEASVQVQAKSILVMVRAPGQRIEPMKPHRLRLQSLTLMKYLEYPEMPTPKT